MDKLMNNLPSNSYPSFVRVIIRHGDLFLVIKECKKNYNYWNFAGGKIEIDEDKITAAQREVKEEVNLELSGLSYLAHNIYSFSHFGTWNGYYFIANAANPDLIHLNEPTKCLGYCWMTLDEIKQISNFAGDKEMLDKI